MPTKVNKKKVDDVLKELQAFQIILDGKELSNKSLQEWCGHMNYLFGSLLSEININFQLLREAGYMPTEADIPEMSKEVGGFYI